MSELKIIKVNKYNSEIKKLYKEAFPKYERAPMWLLKKLAKKNESGFYGIYDEEKFVGLLYNVYYEDIVFIFYLAIDEKLRGQGYGSKIIQLIKHKYSERRIILNIEKVDSSYKNNEQRIRRKKFYEKNGFFSLNYTVKEGPEIYEMLCYSKNNSKVSKEEYFKLLKNFFGSFVYMIYRKISE